ncbi:MAG: hypothetical protein AAFO94_04855, partial [Bacteroidota bacterium]
ESSDLSDFSFINLAKEEGIAPALRLYGSAILRRSNRRQMQALRRIFKNYKPLLKAVALVADKRRGDSQRIELVGRKAVSKTA